MSVRRPLLLPLVPLYAAGLRLKNRTLPEPKRLHFPVISVGSISAGGAGKTPITLLLIDLLRRQGFAPVVLSRGYKREGSDTECVDANGSAARFGDEPLLLAQRSAAPVYVGSDRYAAGLLAEQQAEANTVFVLDDGFQHRRLARQIDIVLLTQQEVEDTLLPAGDLREPLAALQRADVIVLREEEALSLRPLLLQNGASIWLIRRSLHFADTPPQVPLAFCGIARPEGFLAMLRAAGSQPAGHLFFADHHAYEERDLQKLLEAALAHKADAFVTTEKDAVKLSTAMRSKLEAQLPLVTAELRVSLADENIALEELRTRLKQ